MRNMKFLPSLLGMTLLGLVFVYVAFYFVFLDLFVDYWWFQDLKYEGYFWLRLLYRFFLSGAVTLFFFFVFFLHFWIATRYLGLNPPDDLPRQGKRWQRYQRFSDMFMSGSLKFYTPLSFILAVIIAMPFYREWETALLYFSGYLFAPESGVADPVYGYDVNFYLFAYPIYTLIQKEMLFTASIVFAMVGVLYWLEHIFVPNQKKEYPQGVKIHLTVLIGFVLLFVAWGFMLERFSLLYVTRHEPVFSGPGFVELRYYLPLIWCSLITFLLASVSAISYLFSQRRGAAKSAVICLLLFAATLVLRDVDTIPKTIEALYVKSNPVKAEETFMRYNIAATQAAFGLDKINTVDFTVKLDPSEDIKQWVNKKHLENVPVWDREFLGDVYRELQGIRPYYNFLTVDEDRYFLNGHLQQVNLAARELNIAKLPPEAQNWENTHLRYTHGYGAVITSASQDAGKPQTWFLRDLNLQSGVGIDLSVRNADIYYGLENYDYAIVPNRLDVVGISRSIPDVDAPFKGKGGVSIQSLFRKALLAFYFRDHKIFFSTNIGQESKILFHRNIIKRMQKLVPFLHLDKDPYLVRTPDRFYWVQDAYTLSNRYPVSKPASEAFFSGEHQFNYIRNSVKIVVDAYDGDVNLYASEPSDSIIQAYRLAYPGVFKDLRDLGKLAPELPYHLRYPRELYYLQMQIYAKYHQQEPALFYEQAETWQLAQANNKTVMPYYITMDFGNCNGREEFVLLTPMTPVNRSNLSMLGMAGVVDNSVCDNAYRPGITVYKFNKDTQVNGPAQVDALINQTPEVAELFTLWDQHGSKVLRGRMIILPMVHSMLYVQPVYLVSTATRIPQLVRVIVSSGDEVVMDTTLVGAFQKLHDLFVQGGKPESKKDLVIPNETPVAEPAEPKQDN